MNRIVRLARAWEQLPESSLFHGFRPATVPLLVLDDTATYALTEEPPAGFRPLPGQPGLAIHEGRHPVLVADSIAEIEGRRYGTLLTFHEAATEGELVALAVHEAFHVHQAERFPSWGANEAAFFTYPFTNARNEAGKRLEQVALERALTNPDTSARWARTHLDLRAARYATLPTDAATYERELERYEGLARYVEAKIHSSRHSLAARFAPTDVRRRSYTIGAGLARLLDRLQPSWQRNLAASPEMYLDDLLRHARLAPPATFPRLDVQAAHDEAQQAVEEVHAERTLKFETFTSKAGWRVTIEASSPLRPRGFDPMNLHLLDDGKVLHDRYLALANEHVDVEILAYAALTDGTGSHPLLHGTSRVEIAGIDAEPQRHVRDGRTHITAPGVDIRMATNAAHITITRTTT